MKTLEQARKEFWDNLGEGAICECCDRFGKIYERKLSSGMARALILMCNILGESNDFVHLSDFMMEHQVSQSTDAA